MTCVAHLLYNCTIKIKSHFEDVDQLIAKVKAVTIKNKTKQAKFFAIGYPPQPVLQDGEAGQMLPRITQKVCLK